MKLQIEYPNYTSALMFFIADKNPVLTSNDSKIFSYFIPLSNFKKGFDYYELTSHKSGGVYFSIVTMLGLKTIVRTNSDIYSYDLDERKWNDIIYSATMNHFHKEEYIALKQGYVKKRNSGCAGLLVFLILILMIFGQQL